MKQTFFNLPINKQEIIVRACIEEFGTHGYTQGATDRIIKRAGISKGGLYEYISSKEELFLYTVDFSYSRLYQFIESAIKIGGKPLPDDILDCFHVIASIAIDFYVDNPDIILFITQCSHITDPSLLNKVQQLFQNRFRVVFSAISQENLAYSIETLMDLLQWLLVKTRNDFVLQTLSHTEVKELRADYMKEWDFILDILRNGIYTRDASRHNPVEKENGQC